MNAQEPTVLAGGGSMSQWLAERTTRDDTSRVTFAALFDDYVQWCRRSAMPVMERQTFAKRLDAFGIERYRFAPDGTKGRQGIRIMPEPLAAEQSVGEPDAVSSGGLAHASGSPNTGARMSSGDIWKLDRLRHTNGEAARLMKEASGKKEYYAAAQPMLGEPTAFPSPDAVSRNERASRPEGTRSGEGTGAAEHDGDPDQESESSRQSKRGARGLVGLTVDVPAAARDRYHRLRGTRPSPQFLPMLLDTYEQMEKGSHVTARTVHGEPFSTLARPIADSVPFVTPAAMELLRAYQSRHAIGTIVDAAKHAVEAAERTARLQAEVTAHAQALATAGDELARVTRERDELAARPDPVMFAPPTVVADGAVRDVLFDFVEACTGATARLDASGEVTVALTPSAPGALFAIWGRAVAALGLSKASCRVPQ